MESTENTSNIKFNFKIPFNIFLLVVVFSLAVAIWYVWNSVNQKVVQDESVPQQIEIDSPTEPVPRQLTVEERDAQVEELEARQTYNTIQTEEQNIKVEELEKLQTQQIPSAEERAAKIKALEDRQFTQ